MSNYEYNYFDGEYFHKFNIVEIDDDKMTATVAITCAGRISVQDFDLQQNENGLYFEYGPLLDNIYLENFEIIN